MKKSVIISILVLVLAPASHILAEAPKAMDQLTALAPQQEISIPAKDTIQKTAVVMIEKGRPIRTIFFETDNSKPLFDDTAGSSKNNKDYYGSYGRRTCIATDTGWEEHWGGHGGGPSELDACRECLREHGSCRYSCSVQQFRCTAQFNPTPAPVEPGQEQPPLPAPTTYTGDLRPDRGSAQDNATLRCMQYTQGRSGYCTIRNCNRESHVVKRGRCRK